MRKRKWKQRALDAEYGIMLLEDSLVRWKASWAYEFEEAARLKFKYEPETMEGPW